MGTICLNPIYVLKPDKGRTLLLLKELIRYNDFVKNGTEFIIHPIHAIILNFADGSDYETVINKSSDFLHADRSFVEKFLKPLIDNEHYVEYHSEYLPDGYRLPPKVIVTSSVKRNDTFPPNSFKSDNIDLSIKRHYTPTNIVLMLNNRCVTNCFYCYADKRRLIDCQIPTERIKQLIKEAKVLNVNTFNVIGGEFFLYSHWKEILYYLHQYGYHPYLSTKVPLSENSIKSLSTLKIKDLQISLDSLITNHVCGILNVSEIYIDKLKMSFDLFQQYGIKIAIHTILNSQNQTCDDMQSLFDFLVKYENVHEWRIDVAAPSLYASQPYQSIKPNDVNVDLIINFLKEIESKAKFRIILPRRKSYSFQEKNKLALFDKRAVCSANYSGFFILPDGNVTICEELYWNKKFIIGNVLHQSLEEIWNSSSALKLYYLSQKEIPEDSKCSRCSQFTQCRLGKGVCWKSVLHKYGESKWYYPDPLCPF